MIGDPRDVGERSMLSEEEIAHNIAAIQDQIRSFIDYTDGKAIMVNNADWLGKFSLIDYLRDLGKNFSLNTMLDRETVKRRLGSDGISYTEFSYMLLESYDYVHLNREYDCFRRRPQPTHEPNQGAWLNRAIGYGCARAKIWQIHGWRQTLVRS